MKVQVNMSADEFDRYRSYCREKLEMKREVKKELLTLEQYVGRRCYALLEGVELTEQGMVHIKSDTQLTTALELATDWYHWQ